MKIRVRLFAILRDRAGTSEVALTLADDATPATAASALNDQFPGLVPAGLKVAYAINSSYAAASTPLSDGDELALIPPVSGG